MFKIIITLITLLNTAFTQMSDEAFILENIEMLEALELLESDVDIQDVDTDEKNFQESKPAPKEEEKENV